MDNPDSETGAASCQAEGGGGLEAGADPGFE